MNNIIDDLAAEGYEAETNSLGHSEKRGHIPFVPLAEYKIWNPDPKKPDAPRTPGIIMSTQLTTGYRPDGSAIKEYKKDLTEKVNAVILFASPARKLKVQQGKTILCQSHDNHAPSLRIDQPLCRKSTTEDIVNIISQWKGLDQAKIMSKVQEVTEGGKLVFCGLQKEDGEVIPLCPFSKKDPITGASAACKQNIFVRAYDIDRKREFTMELTGSSMQNNSKFISPFHEFFRYIRTAGKDRTGLPCYVFNVTLESKVSGAYYLLGVSSPSIEADKEQRHRNRGMAIEAKEAYERAAHRLSKEAYAKSKAAQNATPATVEVKVVSDPTVVAQDNRPVDETPFDDDDIPF